MKKKTAKKSNREPETILKFYNQAHKEMTDWFVKNKITDFYLVNKITEKAQALLRSDYKYSKLSNTKLLDRAHKEVAKEFRKELVTSSSFQARKHLQRLLKND